MTASISFVCALQTSGDNFVAALYDPSTSPMTLVESQYIPPVSGYPTPPTPFQVTFLTSLTIGKVYRVILWESITTSPGGISRVSGDFTASLNGVTLRGDLRLVGSSSSGMVVGTSGYVDPANSLAGWNYSLELFGSGTLGLGVDYTIDPTTGNWTLINGMTIQAGQIFIIHFQPQISAASPPSPALITSGQTITVNTTLDTSYKNQALFVQGAAAAITLILPALSSFADYTDRLVFYSNGGSHINALFPTQGTDKISYRGLLTQLVLGQGETMELFKANGVWNVGGQLPGVDNVGQIIDSMMALPNTIQLAGQLLDRTQYARLYAWASAVNMFVSETLWGSSSGGYYTYKGFFTQGTTSSNFRVPDLRAYGFTRAVDGSVRTAGNFQLQLVGAHTQATHGNGPIQGSGGPYYLKTATTPSEDHSYSGGGGDGFGRSTTVDTNMRTSDGTDDPAARVGAENRSNNTGVLRLIRY